MVTSIQVSEELKQTLEKRKLSSRESYEEIIWDLIEDTQIVNEQTLKEIEEAREQYKRGETISHEDLRKKLNV
jgi:predicted nucleic-acid-binding protein